MKVSAKYIMLAMPLLLAACEKENVAPSQSDDNYIKIGVGMAETRARMNASDLKNANTQLTVYGYDGTDIPVFNGLTATPPSQQGGQQGAVKISNWTIKDATGADLEPTWEDGKDYTFFSWTQQDAFGKTASGLFTAGFTYTAAKASTTSTEGDTPAQLAIEATALPIDAGIMDFCYSNVETRSTSTTATNRPNYSMIQLKLEHLFSGFSLSAHNYTDQDIVITSIILDGIYNKKSALIKFNTDLEVGVTTEFDNEAALSDEQLLTSTEISAGGVTVASNSTVQNLAKGSGSDSKYFLMWPQTKAELASAKLTVSYKVGGVTQTPVELAVPGDEVADGTDFSWPAGVCRNIELSFMNKSLKLTMTPLDWNLIESSIDYSELASVGACLLFSDGTGGTDATCIKEEIPTTDDGDDDPLHHYYKIYFKGDKPIEATFRVDQPLNGSWMVSKTGDFDAFEIDNIGTGTPGDGVNTLEGKINALMSTISICPAITDPERDYTMQLSFSVRDAKGAVTGIDDKIFTDGTETYYYTIVLLKK